jgi:hypothetical protein
MSKHDIPLAIVLEGGKYSSVQSVHFSGLSRGGDGPKLRAEKTKRIST